MSSYAENQLEKSLRCRVKYEVQSREVPEHLSTCYLAGKFQTSPEEIERRLVTVRDSRPLHLDAEAGNDNVGT